MDRPVIDMRKVEITWICTLCGAENRAGQDRLTSLILTQDEHRVEVDLGYTNLDCLMCTSAEMLNAQRRKDTDAAFVRGWREGVTDSINHLQLFQAAMGKGTVGLVWRVVAPVAHATMTTAIDSLKEFLDV